ncbi:helix-turn-helix transcriptional regulator [Paraburkholderia strydomiana]|uniref:helix-turn-helix transcriptional regulator n=1 Tax=Paraburkholderia strydomiana TaxID=1245417 RepID=UPI0038BCF14F
MPNIKQPPQHQLAPPPSSIPVESSSAVRQLDKALRILRMKELIERTGLSRATLYVLMAKDPTFPSKIQLTVRTIGFYEHEVEGWLASRAQMRAVA